MGWGDLIIIFVTVRLITAMRYLDTMPGYSCPKYCTTDHIHYLDLQSGLDEEIMENAKVNKNIELASK